MDIVHISDTHGKHKYVEIPPCDVLIHSGDISSMGYKHEVLNFFEWFINQDQAQYKILICGNHDLSFDPKKNPDGEKPEWLQQALYDFERHTEDLESDEQLNFYLENTGCEIWGTKFWGSPVTPEFHDWGFNEYRGKDIAKVWSKIPLDTDVLITHGPPAGVLDYTEMDMLQVGCADLRRKIVEVKPKLHLFGHIHEGYGFYESKFIYPETRFYNGSICNLRYNPVNSPHIIEL